MLTSGFAQQTLDAPDEGSRSETPVAPKYQTIDEAIARGDLDDVRRHILADAQSVQQGRHESLTPLHQAILRKKTEIAVALVEAGADPNRPDGAKRTPLHLAAERGDAAVAQALVSAKAEPNHLDQNGWSPLHLAAAKNQVLVARVLLEGAADPAVRSGLGGTPLHEAAVSADAELVQLLLDAGLDPSIKAQDGGTALNIARKYNNEAAIRLLQVDEGDKAGPGQVN